MGLDAGVVDAEGENGEAVDDEAGSFGVEGCGGVLGGEVGEQPLVHLFHQIVAALVEAVDGVLDLGEASVGGTGVASLVFFVPEVIVFAVLLRGQSEEGVWFLRSMGRFVPGGGEAVVEAGDGSGLDHECRGQIC